MFYYEQLELSTGYFRMATAALDALDALTSVGFEGREAARGMLDYLGVV
jgi:hypothetical protein